MNTPELLGLLVGIIGTSTAIYQTAVINEGKKKARITVSFGRYKQCCKSKANGVAKSNKFITPHQLKKIIKFFNLSLGQEMM
ncbi:MAG: hypothetical protein Q9N62_03765 [Ghiorsea sp.]|nr:hypothetical protein [Ghiorsea sp.]